MDITMLKKRMCKWQERLGLSNWQISLSFKSCHDISDQNAQTIIYAEQERAIISILKPEDLRKSEKFPGGGSELDLLHELIHIRLWAIDPSKPDHNTHILREQSIDWIARALLSAENDGKPGCV